MAKVELILKTWQTLSDGTSPIVLRVSKRKERRLFVTNISATAEQWDAERAQFITDKRIIKNPLTLKDHKANNEDLIKLKSKALMIIEDYERMGIDFTIRQFEQKYNSKTLDLTPGEYFVQHIETLTKEGKFGNADVFRCTHRILKLFDKRFDKIKFPDIDVKYVNRFDAYLRNERGLKETSISVYMRTLAALLNSAIRDNLAQQDMYPFKGNGYKIHELNTKTRKRYIPLKYLRTLKQHKFDDLRLEIAKNLFLFSFYCRGINWVDMALLKPTDIYKEISKDGNPITEIRYKRQKTKKDYIITVNDDIQSLLDYFKSIPHCEQYLLPIITVPENKGESLRLHIKERLHKHNKALAEIAKTEELRFPDALHKISSYFSRHSYAMALRQKGTNIELIQESLGHSDLKTTTIYIDSFGKEAVAEVSKNLL